MKHGKRPTVRQKKLMASMKLNPDEWLVASDTYERMIVINRYSDKTQRIIRKENQKWQH